LHGLEIPLGKTSFILSQLFIPVIAKLACWHDRKRSFFWLDFLPGIVAAIVMNIRGQHFAFVRLEALPIVFQRRGYTFAHAESSR
jgi:hypothetical protein